MLAMNTKKPRNPTTVTPSTTSDTGLSNPSHPASSPTNRPGQPIHRGSSGAEDRYRVQRHSDPPAQEIPRSIGDERGHREGFERCCQRLLSCSVGADVRGDKFVLNRDRDQVGDRHQSEPDRTQDRCKDHDFPGVPQRGIEPPPAQRFRRSP